MSIEPLVPTNTEVPVLDIARSDLPIKKYNHQSIDDMLAQIHSEGVDISAHTSNTLGRLATRLGIYGGVMGAAELGNHHDSSGGALLAFAIAAGTFASAFFADAEDKKMLDTMGLPYNIRRSLDGSPHHD